MLYYINTYNFIFCYVKRNYIILSNNRSENYDFLKRASGAGRDGDELDHPCVKTILAVRSRTTTGALTEAFYTWYTAFGHRLSVDSARLKLPT